MWFLLLLHLLSSQVDTTGNIQVLEQYQLSGDFTDSVFIDTKDNVAIFVHYYKGIPIDTYNIMPLERYLDSIQTKTLIDDYLSITPESAKTTGAGEGLIPTIDVPIRFPKALSFLGEGGKLDIRGSENILMGGQSTYMHDPSMGADTGSSFPTLNLESSMNVLLTGTVGSKLHITLDYDQKREDQNKNIIKLNYTGDEDEVVQSIEAGQTSFSIQGTQFASFAGGGGKSGLFGLKGIFNFGGVNVQGVLTRETAESSQGTFIGGAREDSTVLFDRDYLKNKFFYIDEPDSIVRIFVLVHDGSGVQSGEIYHCVALYYEPGTRQFDSTLSEHTKFKILVDQTDYYFYPESKVLELKNALEEGNILGVSYETASGRWVGDSEFNPDSTMSIRLIKPSRYMNNIDSLNSRADTLRARLFELELKNIYPIEFYSMGENQALSIDDITLTIYKDSLGSNVWKSGEGGRTYLQILGIDNNGDGKIDPTVTVNGKFVQVFDGIRHYLIFPDAHPFASDSLQDPDSIIYKKQDLRSNEGQKYKLVFKMKATLSRTINLGQSDIVEGSEVVKYNGKILQRNRDYTIDYSMGTITLLDTSILNDPNAKIEINYDYSPVFQSKSRSLYGLRANYGNKRLRFGATFLGRSETQDVKRPQLGQEPVKNMIMEGDFQINRDLNFLSPLLRKITWNSEARAPNLRLQGEVARSMPNLNTIGFGYIDDMDNAKISHSVYLNYTYWKYGSRPVLADKSYAPLDLLCDKVNWFTFTNLFKKGDIYDNLTDEEARQSTNVLAIRIKPHNNDTASYASLSQLLDDRGISIDEMEYLDVVVHGDRGKIHIDLGPYISEDAIWRDKDGNIKGWHHDSLSVIDTEDKNNDGQWIAGSEDTGLDGVFGSDSAQVKGDDGNDDFKPYNPKTGDWSHVNGTEHNGIFDTEELKVDGVLDTTNAYFEYTIDLSDTNSPYLKSINKNGFRHYLIPLKDPSIYRKVGSPDFENIRIARIWINGISSERTYYFANIELVGSKWQKIGIFSRDSTFPVDSTEKIGVRTVSVKEDPTYTTPQGVNLERDPLTGELEVERSLGVSYTNLKEKHYAVIRLYTENTQDLLGYKNLHFFVKPSHATSPPYPKLWIRVGDTVNYYEYRVKITNSDWVDINIPLDSITRYRMYVQDSLGAAFSADSVYFNGKFGFKGTPNLRSVRNYDFIIENDTPSSLNGELWIDELRLSSPRNEIGTAYSFRGSMQFGSLLSLSYNLTYKGESFKSFSQSLSQFGNSTKSLNYQLSFKPSLFLPPDFGINIDASYSHAFSVTLPRYKPNTDIILDEQQKKKNQSVNISDRYSLRYSKSRSKNKLLNIFLDPFTFSASKTKSNRTSPTARGHNLSNAITAGYTYSPHLSFKLFGHTINLLPTSISLGSSYAYNYSVNNDLFSNITRKDSNKALSLNYGINLSPLSSITARLTKSIARDLYWDSISAKKYGHISQITQNFSLSYGVELLKIARPNISFNSSFSQRFDKNLQSDTIKDVSNITNNANITIQSNLYIGKMIGWILGEGEQKKNDTILSPGSYILSQLRKIGGYITPPNLSYNIQKGSNYQYIVGNISRKYQFGLEFDPKVSTLMENRATSSKRYALNLNEGFNLPIGNLHLSYSFNKNKSHTYGQEQTTKQTTWPNITFSLSSGFLNPIVKNGNIISNPSLSISYNLKKEIQGVEKDTSPRTTSRALTLTPQVSLSLFKKVHFNVNYNLSSQWDTSHIGTPQETHTIQNGITSSLSYATRLPQGIKIPGLGRIRMTNEITITLSYSLNKNKSNRTNIETNETVPITENVTSTLNLSASYNFSRDITGTLTFSRSGNNDKLHQRSTRSTSLNAKATFRF